MKPEFTINALQSLHSMYMCIALKVPGSKHARTRFWMSSMCPLSSEWVSGVKLGGDCGEEGNRPPYATMPCLREGSPYHTMPCLGRVTLSLNAVSQGIDHPTPQCCTFGMGHPSTQCRVSGKGHPITQCRVSGNRPPYATMPYLWNGPPFHTVPCLREGSPYPTMPCLRMVFL